jgi:hypothetical protein
MFLGDDEIIKESLLTADPSWEVDSSLAFASVTFGQSVVSK